MGEPEGDASRAATATEDDARRADSQVAERVVEIEGALGPRRLAAIVESVDDPAPAPLGLGCALLSAPRPVQRVRTRLFRAGLRLASDSVGADQARSHGRRPHDLVAHLLRLVDAVPVRREHVGRRSRRLDSVVEDEEAVGDSALAGGIGRTVEQLPVEGHRRRGARVERARGDGAEPHYLLGELEVRHPGAVAGHGAVDRDEDHPPVGALADRGARSAERELVARELLLGPEHRSSVLDDQRAASDRVDDTAPLRAEDEADRDLLPDRRLAREAARGGAAPDEDRAARRDRSPTCGLRRDNGSGQVGQRRDRRERAEHDLDRVGRGRGRSAPGGGEQRHALGTGGLVQAGHRPSLARALPGRDHGHLLDEEATVTRHPDGGAPGVRRGRHEAGVHEHAVRRAVVVGVDVVRQSWSDARLNQHEGD